jgi:hypothetical protein
VDALLLKLFAMNVPAIELVLRGTAIYLLLFVLFRFVLRRESVSFGMADLLVLVLISETAQNTMTGEFTTIPEGAVLIATILGWHVLFNWLWFRLHRPPAGDDRLARANGAHSSNILKGNPS